MTFIDIYLTIVTALILGFVPQSADTQEAPLPLPVVQQDARRAKGPARVTGDLTGQIFGVTPGDPSEVPLAGADVFVVLGQQIIAQTISDAGGFYSITGLAPDTYVLVSQANGFNQQFFFPVEILSNTTTQLSLLMASQSTCPNCAFLNVTTSKGLSAYQATTGDGHAPGGVFADLDNDGFPELYLMRAASGAGSPANQLYRNMIGSLGGRKFVRALNDAGAGDTGNATGAIAGDYDNDGDLDLYVINFDQPNVLLQNQWAQNGILLFIDVTADTDPTPGLADDQFGVGIAFFEGVPLDNSLTAAWADVDRDGDLDLYVGNHNGYVGDVPEGPFTVPGRRDVFYFNNGDGTFTEATMAVGAPGYISETGQFQTPNQRFSSSNAVVFADFDNDGWPDLLVSNKVGGPDDRDMIYLNFGNGPGGTWLGFVPVTYDLVPQFGAATDCSMGTDAADVDNDGDIDIYLTDCSGPFGSPGSNDLWMNRLSQTGTLGFSLSGVMPAIFSWGAQWQDFDNDGHLDLHVATSGALRDFLYMNTTGTAGGLVESAIPLGVPQVRESRGDLSADFNRDGWADLFIVNIDSGPSVLYQNNFAAQGIDNHHLVIKLEGDPLLSGLFHSSRDAIGARAHLIADLNGDGLIATGETQLREVLSGNGNSGSTNSLELEFGLGQATIATLEIDWPSGRHSVAIIQADQFLNITERLIGDLNGDRIVNAADVGPFVQAMIGQGIGITQMIAADTNIDGFANGEDIQLFVEQLIMP